MNLLILVPGSVVTVPDVLWCMRASFDLACDECLIDLTVLYSKHIVRGHENRVHYGLHVVIQRGCVTWVRRESIIGVPSVGIAWVCPLWKLFKCLLWIITLLSDLIISLMWHISLKQFLWPYHIDLCQVNCVVCHSVIIYVSSVGIV